MKTWVILAAAIAMASASTARAADVTKGAPAPAAHASDSDSDSDLPVEGEITDPDWVQLPSGDEMGRFYPPLARQIALTGAARMTCEVNALGMLENCMVISETPAGVGFGAAALQMAPYFRMRPRTVNGAPVGGASVTIPLNFTMGGNDGPTQADTPAPAAPAGAPAAAPEERALAMGRRLAAVVIGDDVGHEQLVQAMRTGVTQLAAAGQVDAIPATNLVDDYAQAYSDSMPAWRDKMGDYFARNVSEADLASISAFLESPAGRVWAKLTTNSASALRSAQAAWLKDVNADARKRFCATTICPGTRPAAHAASK